MLRPSFKRKLNRGDYALIFANLLPVYGVWFQGWSPTEAFVVYALETLIAGILTIVKLGIMTFVRKQDNWYNEGSSTRVSGLFFIFFFTVHFGLFAAVQTSIFSHAARLVPANAGLLHFFFHWYEYVNRDVAIMLAAFVISYLIRGLLPFIMKEEYRSMSMTRVMFQPYGRIVVQQFTVILGSMFLSLNLGKVFILVFALAKILFEVYLDLEGFIDKSMADFESKSGNNNFN